MKKIRNVFIVLVAAVFLVSVFMVVRQQMLYRKIVDDGAEAAQIAGLPAPGSTPPPVQDPPQDPPSGEPQDPPPDADPEPPPEPLPEEAASLAQLDLAALQEVNADVVGWIQIPGTELSYPLVQGTDNQFYLTHNWKRERSGGGSVFLECTNSRDLAGFHTIVYAHRMRNDTMFGTLKYYKEQNFWQEHPSVYIAAEDGIYRYDIFSAEEADVTGIIYRLDLVSSHLEEGFIWYCLKSSVIETGIVPETDDRFLTLSTCTGNGHATRWVVHAVLAHVYDWETEDGEP